MNDRMNENKKYFSFIAQNTRDETIRSSHDTIHIDTKGDDMVIFDTIRIVIVEMQTFTVFTSFYL